MASSSKASGKSKRINRLESSDSDDGQEQLDSCEATGGKRMKKDDSGINVIEENCSSDESVSSKQKVSEQSSPDSGNIEPCIFADLRLDEKASGSSDVKKIPLLSTSISHEKKANTKSKYKNFSQRVAFTSSSSDSECESSSDSSSNKDSASDKELLNSKTEAERKDNKLYDPTPNTPRPKHKWIAPIAITSRQYGFSQKQSPDYFKNNYYGSLHVVEHFELMYKMKKHDGCVNALHFNSTGTKLASGSDDLNIVIWDWTIGEPIYGYDSGHRTNVFQAKFMPMSQDNSIVSCGRDGQVRVGEFSSAGEVRKTRKLAQHKGAAHKLALHMDSPHTFLSCGEDAAVFMIDLRAERPQKLGICKEKLQNVPLYSIYANPLKSYEYVVGGRNPFVKVYDSRFNQQNKGYLKKLCPAHLATDKESDAKNVTSVVYNYNGEEILASYNDDDIYLFESKEDDGSKYLHRYRGHKNSQTVKGVNYFGPKSEYIISGSDCGFIFFWEKESEHVVKYMYGDEGGVVNCLEPNPIVPVLATSGLDNDVKIWVPSSDDTPDLLELKKHLIANMREREEERRNCPEAFIDQTIWFLMQHLARSQRGTSSPDRDERNLSVIELSTSSSDSDSQGAEEDSEFRREVQCNQS